METKPRILLGVSGSVAAFKAAVLASELTKSGAAVRTILTAGGERFLSAETLQGLTGEGVATSLWQGGIAGEMGHIALAHWAELIVVAPASANLLARMALGLADDLLTTVVLASSAPILVAPAMETHMWEHEATQGHVRALARRGIVFVGPVEGRLASGATGGGRMAEPEEILTQITRRAPGFAMSNTQSSPRDDGDPHATTAPTGGESTTVVNTAALDSLESACGRDLAGLRVVVTAGPTREPIDPVRYISNRSSGKMGFELAIAAQARGARVTLVSGPVERALRERLPEGVAHVEVETAREMKDAVVGAAAQMDVIVMAAAVADFRPASPSGQKLKKSSRPGSIAVTPTDDILSILQEIAPAAIRVGFAAETDNLVARATEKLDKKGLAMIVANDVSADGEVVFGADTNRVTILLPGSPPEALPRLSKRQVADAILDRIGRLSAKNPE